MIQLEHLNLVVQDIPAALRFYRAAFPHWSVRGEGEGDWYGKPRRWCHFGDNDQYLTLNDNGEGNNRDLESHDSGLAHFAFVTQDLAGITARLKAAGFAISHPGVEHPYRRNVYFMDADGFEVEFVQYLSDESTKRNAYETTVQGLSGLA